MQISWTMDENMSFEGLKERVYQKTILVLPNFKKIFTIEYDASKMSIRVALSHEGKEITFFNETLNEEK